MQRYKAVVLFLFCFFNSSCVTLYHYYDYYKINSECNEIIIYSKLCGNFKKINRFKVSKTSPYDLFIFIEPCKKKSRNDFFSITLKDIKLYNDDRIVFREKNITKQLNKDYNGLYSVSFSFKKLNLDYTNYKLVIKCNINTQKGNIDKEVILDFNKKYRKEFSLNFWDMLMSQ